jgi:hypothetical protein
MTAAMTAILETRLVSFCFDCEARRPVETCACCVADDDACEYDCSICGGPMSGPTDCGCCGSPQCSVYCGCKGLYEDYWCFACQCAHANPCVGAAEYEASERVDSK